MQIDRYNGPLEAPPLTDKTRPWGVARFRHKDGTIREFYSVVNEMSGSRLSAFGREAPSIGDDMSWVRSVFRDIHRKATDVEYIGTIKWKP